MSENWPFLAGLIDGDGTISIKNGKRVELRFSVSSSEPVLLDYLTKVYGGHVYQDEGTSARSFESRKKKYKWYVSVRAAQEKYLLALRPFLVIKEIQAGLALQFLQERNGDARREIARQCSIANHAFADCELKKSEPKESFRYVAGLVEAEGSISVCSNGCGSFRSYIHVYNSQELLMRWLVLHFGGKYYYRPPRGKSDAQYTWHLSGRKNRIRFINEVLPFLVSKRRQAEFTLKYLTLPERYCPEQRKELARLIVESRNDYTQDRVLEDIV